MRSRSASIAPSLERSTAPPAIKGGKGARLIAVADAWDVMTRARHYGTVKTVDEALEEIDRCSGAQFWPAAVDAMKRVIQHSAPARIG